MSKKGKFILIGSCLLFLILSVIYILITDRNLEKEGIYSIATIEKVEGARRGKMVHLSYKFQSKVFRNSYIEDPTKISKKDVGNHYFIKFRPLEPDGNFDLILENSVPDSIKESPKNGWKELPIEL